MVDHIPEFITGYIDIEFFKGDITFVETETFELERYGKRLNTFLIKYQKPLLAIEILIWLLIRFLSLHTLDSKRDNICSQLL
jgi:hypothetical protein